MSLICAYKDGFPFHVGARVIGAALGWATCRQCERGRGRREGGRKSSATMNQFDLI